MKFVIELELDFGIRKGGNKRFFALSFLEDIKNNLYKLSNQFVQIVNAELKEIEEPDKSNFSNHALSVKHCDCPLGDYEPTTSKDEEVNNGNEIITYHCEGCDTDWAIEDADTGELLAYYDLARKEYVYNKPELFEDLKEDL